MAHTFSFPSKLLLLLVFFHTVSYCYSSRNYSRHRHACLAKIRDSPLTVKVPIGGKPYLMQDICPIVFKCMGYGLCDPFPSKFLFQGTSFAYQLFDAANIVAFNQTVVFTVYTRPHTAWKAELLDFHATRLTWTFRTHISSSHCPLFVTSSMSDTQYVNGRYCSNSSVSINFPGGTSWNQFANDTKQFTTYIKFVVAEMLVHMNFTVVFVDTDSWFESLHLSALNSYVSMYNFPAIVDAEFVVLAPRTWNGSRLTQQACIVPQTTAKCHPNKPETDAWVDWMPSSLTPLLHQQFIITGVCALATWLSLLLFQPSNFSEAWSAFSRSMRCNILFG